MSRQEQNKIARKIEELKRRLENWIHVPVMMSSVKEIGARAIRDELARVAEPLKNSGR